jgi:hypothetical protein
MLSNRMFERVIDYNRFNLRSRFSVESYSWISKLGYLIFLNKQLFRDKFFILINEIRSIFRLYKELPMSVDIVIFSMSKFSITNSLMELKAKRVELKIENSAN